MNTLQIAIIEACCEAFGVTPMKMVAALSTPKYPPPEFRMAKWAAMMIIKDRYAHSNQSLSHLFRVAKGTVDYQLREAGRRLKTDKEFAAVVTRLSREFMPWVPTVTNDTDENIRRVPQNQAEHSAVTRD